MTLMVFERRYVCALLMGVMGTVNCSVQLSNFAPPFSNYAFSCRCRPSGIDPFYKNVPQQDLSSFHYKVCELKAYIRDFERHMQSEELKGVCKKNLSIFQAPEIIEKVRTQALKSTLVTLVQKRSFQALEQYWEALKSVVEEDGGQKFELYFAQDFITLHPLVLVKAYSCLQERRIAMAYVLFKDLIDCVYMLYGYMHVTVACVSLDSLPIHQTLKEIDYFRTMSKSST